MIRGLRPTDVLAYIAFRNRVGRSNEAILWPSGGRSPLSIQSFIGRCLSLEPGRETWVQVDGDEGIRGIVAAKSRWGAAVWDIDQLVSLPSSECEVTYLNLLQHLCAAAGRLSVHRVHLRLDCDSGAVSAARHAGFYHYATEHVYRLEARASDPVSSEYTPRARKRSDQQALFQLYSAATPTSVRQVEGMTMQEWRWTDGWRPQPVGWQKGIRSGRRDLICVRGSALLASAKADMSSRTLSICVHPEGQSIAEPILSGFLSALPEGGPVSVTVRDYQPGLQSALERRGCSRTASHVLLVRVMTVRVVERTLMPLRA